MISSALFSYPASLAMLGNILFWSSIFFVERYEAHRGLIPGRRKLDGEGRGFLYLCDWSTASWGDYLGFSFIDLGATIGLVAFWDIHVVVLVLISGFLTVGAFYFYGTSLTHRPDSGFPATGKVSRSGMVHLAYYFVQATIAYWSLYALYALPLSTEAFYLILVGGVIYAVAFLDDCRARRYS